MFQFVLEKISNLGTNLTSVLSDKVRAPLVPAIRFENLANLGTSLTSVLSDKVRRTFGMQKMGLQQKD